MSPTVEIGQKSDNIRNNSQILWVMLNSPAFIGKWNNINATKESEGFEFIPIINFTSSDSCIGGQKYYLNNPDVENFVKQIGIILKHESNGSITYHLVERMIQKNQASVNDSEYGVVEKIIDSSESFYDSITSSRILDTKPLSYVTKLKAINEGLKTCQWFITTA